MNLHQHLRSRPSPTKTSKFSVREGGLFKRSRDFNRQAQRKLRFKFFTEKPWIGDQDFPKVWINLTQRPQRMNVAKKKLRTFASFASLQSSHYLAPLSPLCYPVTTNPSQEREFDCTDWFNCFWFGLGMARCPYLGTSAAKTAVYQHPHCWACYPPVCRPCKWFNDNINHILLFSRNGRICYHPYSVVK